MQSDWALALVQHPQTTPPYLLDQIVEAVIKHNRRVGLPITYRHGQIRSLSGRDQMIDQVILQWNTIRVMDAMTLGLTARVNMDVSNAQALSEADQHLLVVTRVRGLKIGELLLASVRSGLDEKLGSTTIVQCGYHRETYVVCPRGTHSMGTALETTGTIVINEIIGQGNLRASGLIVGALHRCQLHRLMVEVASMLDLVRHNMIHPLIDEILLVIMAIAALFRHDRPPTLAHRLRASIQHAQH